MSSAGKTAGAAFESRRLCVGVTQRAVWRMPNSERRITICARWLCVLVVAGLVCPISVSAAGEEYTRRGDDLAVTVSTRWAGCTHGGYYPIRIQVQNKGVDCTVSFVFTGQHEGVAAAQRTVAVAQNGTVKFTLPVPCVGGGNYGDLKVYRNGRFVENLRETVSIPDRHSGGTPRPAFLVISPTDVDFDPFESAVTSTLPEATGGSGGYGGLGGYYGSASEDHERIEPALLPEEWIAYSGLDLVAMPLATLGKLTTSERSALLKWVHTGGSLIVYEVGQPAAQSQELARLLEINQHAAVGPRWQPADVSRRKRIRIVEAESYGSSYGGTLAAEEEPEPEEAPESEDDFLWADGPETFAGRELMLGRVYAFPENPFPGTPHDWNWLLTSMPTDAKSWTTRHGITARTGSDEFLQFLIPSVRGVPVIAFLLLITLFTVVIGPLNYVWLWKRRRLYLLVLTIPVIAFGTSLALFGYSAVAHGFSTKSRVRSLTFVDQVAKTAVTSSRIALYAGLAPSDGLRFSQDTAVLPIWPENHEFNAAKTDWTQQQNLRSGWLKSRTRTQFLTVSHRDERGRLEIAAGSEDRLNVTNGFEWGFAGLVVSDVAGRLYYGADVPAGASAELTPITASQRNEFAELLKQHPLQPPDLSGQNDGWFNLNWNISGYYGYDPSDAVNFGSGQMEQLMSQAKDLAYGEATFPRSLYAAVLTESPGIALGVDRTGSQASLHVLMGRY